MKQTIMFRKYSWNNDLFILLPERIYREIISHAAKLYHNECGGILIGKVIDKETTSSPTLFKRIADFFNNALQQLFIQTKGKTYYLGDWHSHPDAAPIPSGTDYKAMEEIALNPRIRTETPILLILSYTDRKQEERCYLYHDKKLLAYETM
jgi:integrative and conjugative element protein (TIGR02256 family)